MNTVLSLVLACTGVLPGADHYAEGWKAEARGRNGDAVEAYTAAAEAHGPLMYFAAARAAAARGRAGDVPGAMAQLTTLLEKAPEGPWRPFALYELAVLRARVDQVREASQAFLTALNTDAPLWWLDEYRRVAAQTYLNDPESAGYAYDYFRNVVATTRFIAPRAQAAQHLANSTDAYDLFLATDGLIRGREPKAARDVFVKASSRSADDERAAALVSLMAARISLADGKLTAAEDTLDKLTGSEFVRDQLPGVHLELIREYCRSNRFPQAEFAATRFLERFPAATEQLGEAWWRIGEAYMRKAEYAAALAKFGDLIKRYPDHGRVPEAWYQIGEASRKQGRQASALEAYDKVVERHPDAGVAADAGYMAGEMLEKAGDNDGAILRYERAAHLGLGTYMGHRAQSHLNALRNERGMAMPHECGSSKPLVRPIPEIEKAPPGLDELGDDERIQRLRFFAIHGMPEAEWEVLGLAETLRASLNPGPLYDAIAQAGTAYSAMQIADATDWGLDEKGVRTPERQRVRFPLAYWPLVSDLAAETGVDPYLILAVARQESTYRPALTSYAGARGVMQVMPATAEWLARIEPNIPVTAAEDLENPQVSLRMGAYYLQRMLERSNGNVVYALASYNAGPGNCDKWRRRYGEIGAESFVEKIPFNETQHYVKNVMGYYAAYHSLYTPHVNE